jgi:hypothetical protein
MAFKNIAPWGHIAITLIKGRFLWSLHPLETMDTPVCVHVSRIDCNGVEKDATFISTILIDAIESVGSHNVVQVITDNAQVCRAAGLIVEGRYDHIFWTPCAVHSLNLMLAKIGEIGWINEIYVASKEIQMFITNHSMSQAIYRGFAKLELLKVLHF